jgi:hypothetical protein
MRGRGGELLSIIDSDDVEDISAMMEEALREREMTAVRESS